VFRPALIVHGGAGLLTPEVSGVQRVECAAAIATGWRVLAGGGSALDAVCDAVAVLEDAPVFNAGFGSCLTSDGTVEMDASVMDGTRLTAGAVTLIRGVRNPVHLARAVMLDTPHVMLVGAAAEALAHVRGLPICQPEELITPRQLERWRRNLDDSRGTVGAAAVDCAGHVAAATSTGGLFNKVPGRVGDSAVIGAGTYADDACGAASATGHGEAIMRVVLAKLVVDRLADGTDPAIAAPQGIAALEERVGGTGGIIVVDAFGRVGAAYNTAHMTYGYMRPELTEPYVHA
jgi:L-asparaginase / beta-aspartyl-peptidase